jgi:ABC-type spermidine/putrescine transport system permease subunit II
MKGRDLGRLWLLGITVFMALPLALVVIDSLNPSVLGTFPPRSLSLVWYRNVVANGDFVGAFVNSLVIASASSLVAVLAGMLASLALVRYRFRGNRLVRAALSAPLGIPRVALGLSCFVLFLLLGSWIEATATVLNTQFSLIMVHAVIALPIVLIVISGALVQLDPELERAASMLGATQAQAIYRVIVPAIWPSIVAAAVFAFVFSFDDVEAALFLVPMAGPTLPVAMFDYLETHTDPTLAALSTVLVMVSAVGLLVGATRVGSGALFQEGGDTLKDAT